MQMNHKRLVQSFVLVVLCHSAYSWSADSNKVYRCEKNGVTEFSQVPCEQNAKSVNVKPSQGKGLSPQEARVRIEAEQQNVELYLQSQDIQQQIAQHYRAIAKLKKDLHKQLEQVKQRRFRTAAMRDEAFDALEKRYQSNIKSHHEAIKSLREQQTANN